MVAPWTRRDVAVWSQRTARLVAHRHRDDDEPTGYTRSRVIRPTNAVVVAPTFGATLCDVDSAGESAVRRLLALLAASEREHSESKTDPSTCERYGYGPRRQLCRSNCYSQRWYGKERIDSFGCGVS
jgi:hypothetical protein